MQPQLQQGERQNDNSVRDWMRITSYKILAIGAGLKAFLRYTDRVVFTKEPTHQPDQKFIDELVEMLNQTEPKKQ